VPEALGHLLGYLASQFPILGIRKIELKPVAVLARTAVFSHAREFRILFA